MSRRWLSVLVVAGLAATPLLPSATAEETPTRDAATGCTVGDATVVVGEVTCHLVPSAYVGAPVPVSYYVPPICATSAEPCKTAYLLHGFGGDYKSMLGTATKPSAFVDALTRGPAVDPRTVTDPWTLDRSTWVPRAELPLVLVAPQGRTVAGGFGPGPDLDSFWADWNPRYSGTGDTPRYDTPPPRFESFLVEELIPFAEATLPVGSERADRALDGISLGGYGSFKNGLQHPDLFASLGSISGAHNFLFAPGLDPMGDSPVGVAPPVATPHLSLPGPGGALVPIEALPEQAQGFAVAFLVLGDPAVDQTYFRANMPRDLAANARAFSTSGPAVPMRFFHNDTVPRRQEEITAPHTAAASIALEHAVMPMNLEMDQSLTNVGVPHSYELHPGLHSGPYWDPYVRSQLEAHLAALGQAKRVTTFDYRTIDTDFDVWDWHFAVRRDSLAFLNLRDVSCDGLTLQGSGVVTVRVPGRCKTGRNKTFTVDLGPGAPTDEPGGASASGAYGKTVRLEIPHR